MKIKLDKKTFHKLVLFTWFALIYHCFILILLYASNYEGDADDTVTSHLLVDCQCQAQAA